MPRLAKTILGAHMCRAARRGTAQRVDSMLAKDEHLLREGDVVDEPAHATENNILEDGGQTREAAIMWGAPANFMHEGTV